LRPDCSIRWVAPSSVWSWKPDAVTHAEAMFPDRITAGIRVDRLGGSSVTYGIGLFRNDEETAFADGRFVHVYVDRGTRRPEQLPETWRAKLGEIAQ
jgi:acyl-CoA thioester hydrolase